MRIISGIYGGRRLISPKGDSVRPTSDKIRGAVFNRLRGMVALEGARVLDLFCGTGALGLEALSHGAAHCVFVDCAKKSLDVTRENAEMLGVEDAQFVLKNAVHFEAQGVFDVVFLDPPYGQGLSILALAHVADQGLLASDAYLVVETEAGFNAALPSCYRILDSRAYGDTQIMVLQYTGIDQGEERSA